MCHQSQERLCVLLEEYKVLVMPPDIEGMCRWTQLADHSHSLVVPSRGGCHTLYHYLGDYDMLWLHHQFMLSHYPLSHLQKVIFWS
jgi:hypothetical protein